MVVLQAAVEVSSAIHNLCLYEANHYSKTTAESMQRASGTVVSTSVLGAKVEMLSIASIGLWVSLTTKIMFATIPSVLNPRL